jgi:hypothetical protein
MDPQIVLLADIEDILKGVVPLVVLLLWVIKQVAEAAKAKAPDALPEPAVQRQPEPPAAPRQAAGQQADPLRNQVEEFLRRAGKGQQPGRAQGTPREVEVLLEEVPAQQRGAAVRQLEPGRPATPAAGSSSRRAAAPRKRKSLAERATEKAAARTKQLAEQSSQLGQRIRAEDQQFDVQLKAKFDHTVGTLTGSAVTAAEQAAAAASAAETPAAQIAAMLASPDGVRQAIVVNEILRRPTERW